MDKVEEKKVCISLTDMEGQKVEIPVSDILVIGKCDCFVEVVFTFDGRRRYLRVKEEFGEIFLKIAEVYGVGVLPNKRETLWVQVFGRTSGVTHAVFFYLDDVDAVTFKDGYVEVGVRYYQFTQYAVLKVNKDMLSFSADFARALGCGSEGEVQND